jgi:hypothetical protein
LRCSGITIIGLTADIILDLVQWFEGRERRRVPARMAGLRWPASSSERPPVGAMANVADRTIAVTDMRRWIQAIRSQQPASPYLDIAIEGAAFIDVRERAIACHRSQNSPYEGFVTP